MRIRTRPEGGPPGHRASRHRHVAPDPRRARVDPMRTIAIGALAVLATLAGIAFAPAARAASTAAMPAPFAPSNAAPVAAARYALVLQDAVPLRSGPKSGGAPLALLGQGELLELRGERMDYLQVYDTGRERGGFVRAGAVRALTLAAGEAPELLALVRFLRDRPGSEALGLAFAAAWLKAAPAGTAGAEAFDAMGTLAERLAWRASVGDAAAANAQAVARPGEASVASQLEVARELGFHFNSIDRDGNISLCYDGDAFRRVLSLSPTPDQAARAALALTRHDCIATTLPPLQRWQADQARAALLDRVPLPGLAPYQRNRIRMRQAGVWSAIAFEDSRRLVVESASGAQDLAAGALPAITADDVARAGNEALAALAGIDKGELADDDQSAYADAAARVGASRWAAEPAPPATPAGLGLVTQRGEPGETCVLLVDAKHGAAAALARRCTWGTVWAASARANAGATALVLAVQPLATWRELWMFRATPAGWTVQVLPPSADAIGVGYVEFAGWVPATGELLAAREVRDPARGKRMTRTYELLDGRTLETVRRADAPGALTAFQRWQDPAWQRATVSLR